MDELQTIIISAIIAGIIGYFFGLIRTRHQRHHEIILQAYGEMTYLIRESVNCLTSVHASQTLNLSKDEEFSKDMIGLIKPIYDLGDRDTYFKLECDIENFDYNTKKGRQKLHEYIRTKTINILLLRTKENLRESRRWSTSLLFVPYYASVEQELRNISNMLNEDMKDFAKRSLSKKLGLVEDFPPLDFKAREGMWKTAIASLEKTMKKDLKKTLSLLPHREIQHQQFPSNPVG